MTAGGEALGASPELAARLFTAAAAAGDAASPALLTGRADAAARGCTVLGEALRLADEALREAPGEASPAGTGNPQRRAVRALGITAAVLAHRGCWPGRLSSTSSPRPARPDIRWSRCRC